MANQAFKYEEEIVSVTCCTCGVAFAFPALMQRTLREKHALFYCPSGHAQQFSGKTDTEKLRDELVREKQRREMAEREAQHESKRAAKLERAAERAKKRAVAGVCPCCTRSFENLRRHMATKHAYPVDTQRTRC